MKKIYVVDDHAPVLRVMRLGLEGAGFEVETSNNGAECLAKLVNETPDFLITDIDMPRMTGKELCQAIEAQFPDRAYPIIVLTSRTELEHRDWTASIDNLSFMEKPVSIRRLVAHVSEVLGEGTSV